MAGQLLTKRCPSPLHVGERELPLEAFSRRSETPSGRKSWCKRCIAAQRKLDPEKDRERARRNYWKNQKRNVEHARRKRRENPSYGREYARKKRAENPVLYDARARASRLKNPERHRRQVRFDNLKRRQSLKISGKTTIDKVQARWDYFGGKCWMCGRVANSMDHVKPVSKGGTSFASNLRPACQSCNSSKGATWPYPVAV